MDGISPVRTSKVFALPRLIVADYDAAIESELVKRENVGGPGKTCWFKAADELTENADICFGMGVSPDCRDYTLQALLQQMDHEIVQVQKCKFKGRLNSEDHVEKILSSKDKKQHATRTVFLLNKHKKEPKKHIVGRTVFYVTVGQMKHSKICLKSVGIQKTKNSYISLLFLHEFGSYISHPFIIE